MSWLGQVWHVAAKDVRQTAWAGALVLVGLALATHQALAVDSAIVAAPSPFLSGPVVFYLAGIVFAGLVVQADTPARSDAFWMTHPLAPTAVMGAKVLVAGALLVGLPVGCQILALWAYGSPSPVEALPLIGRSALVQAGVVAMALGAAAVTRDLQSYLLTLILGAVALSFLVGGVLSWLIRNGVRTNDFGSAPSTAPLYLIAGGVAVWLQYRQRSVARTLAWVLPLLAVGLVGGVIVQARTGPKVVGAEGTPPEWLQVQDLRVEVRDLREENFRGAPAESSLVTTLTAPDLPDGYRYTLLPEAWVELPDGTHRSLRLLSRPEPSRPLRVPMDRVRWRDDEVLRPRGDLGAAVLGVPKDLAALVREGGAVLVLGGRMEVSAPRPVAEWPLKAGGRARAGSRVLELVALDLGGSAPTFDVSAEEIVSEWQGWRASPLDDVSLILVDESGTMAAPLVSRSGGGGSGQPLVLPTVEARRWASTYVIPASGRASATDDGVWWRGGRVLVAEWRPIGTYAVTGVRVPLHLSRYSDDSR